MSFCDREQAVQTDNRLYCQAGVMRRGLVDTPAVRLGRISELMLGIT